MRPFADTTNVVRFPGPKGGKSRTRDQRSLLDTVYTQGVLLVPADDRETKGMAAHLQIFGFLNISEMTSDGSARRLKPSEAASTSGERPWRLSRPSFDALTPMAG